MKEIDYINVRNLSTVIAAIDVLGGYHETSESENSDYGVVRRLLGGMRDRLFDEIGIGVDLCADNNQAKMPEHIRRADDFLDEMGAS